MKKLSQILIVGLINFFIICQAHAAIVDNTGAGFFTSGSWGASSFTPGYYGSDYRFASPGSGSNRATWSFSVVAGQYELSAQWAAFENRAGNAAYRVFNNGIEIGMQVFDQRVNGGGFNVFDAIYTVTAGTLDVVLTDDADGYVIADAVQVVFMGSGGNLAPNGVIDTPVAEVTIPVGGSVDFIGTGSDPDGDLPLSYNWSFGDPAIADASVEDPGSVQFNNPGIFTVVFTVTDSLGLADPTPATVQVNVQSVVPAVIVDNTGAGFFTSGSWGASSFTPGYYGSDYRFASPGSGSNRATWSFSVVAGQYELSAQWAAFENRAGNAAYRVFNNGIEIGMQVFDQRVNGGGFNVFDAIYTVTAGTLDVVLTDDADGYVIADAVQVVFMGSGGNLAPNGVIDTPVAEVTIPVGGSVDFIGTGSDPDGDLPLSYNWSFGDPAIADASVEDPGSVQFNNPGIFTVVFTVTDSLGLADPTPATVQVNVQSVVPAVIVDNTDVGFSTIGSWGTSSSAPGYYGDDYRYIGTSPGANKATWSVALPEGKYSVYAQWAAFSNRASNARYSISSNGDELLIYWADQRIDGGSFNFLGSVYFEGGSQEVVLSEIPKMNGYIIADAVKFQNLCTADPCVYITTPQDLYLQPGGSLITAAKVQTTRGTSGYGMRFVIDEDTPNEQVQVDLSEPYEVVFTIVTPSRVEHTLDVYLTDSSGVQLEGPGTHDFITMVGIGNYLVGMGDSTTDGVEDDNIADDISIDFRNGGGGYPPVLNDLLTAANQGLPHTVVNEGIPGARSIDGAATIGGLLAKHPLAQRFLIQYGINDAGAFPPVPSGLGLYPGHPDYPGTFKHNLQQMIDAVNSDGREVCLAKIPIVLGDEITGPQYVDPANPPVNSRGAFVLEYNLVVDELVDDLNNNITISPDLWSKFNEILSNGQHRYESEYFDNVHMNGAGYRSTADAWQKAITEN